MKIQLIILSLLTLSITLKGQQSSYFGVRGEISVLQIKTSESTNNSTPIGAGVGMLWNYVISDQWEMNTEMGLNYHKLTSDVRSYDYGSNTFSPVSQQSSNLISYVFSYTVLKGFGDDQKYKVGLGAFYGFTPSVNFNNGDSQFIGSSSDVEKNYSTTSLQGINSFNVGIALEGVYNFNDVLQFSARYKLGLKNLYNSNSAFTTTISTNNLSWKASYFSLGATFLFGAEARGNIQPSKQTKSGKKDSTPKSSTKKKYNW